MPATRRRVDTAELDGIRNRMLLERLGSRLTDRGPLAVRETFVRRGGTQVTLELDDDSTLELRLFWPRTEVVAALISVGWDDRVGWVVAVRTSAGQRRVDYAWLATLKTPRREVAIIDF